LVVDIISLVAISAYKASNRHARQGVWRFCRATGLIASALRSDKAVEDSRWAVMEWLRGLAIVLGTLAAVWLVLIAVLWLHRPSRELVGPALRLVPDLIGLTRRLLAEPDVPWSVRVALLGLLVWLLNPIDLVPEFIPVLGPLDDVVVAILVLRHVVRRMGRSRIQQLWPGRPDSLGLLLRLIGAASA
jgi:hypothetical protein